MVAVMELRMSFTFLFLLFQASETFIISDISMYPDFISTSRIFADQAVLAMDALRQASVPMTLNTALSIGISEIVAGVAAGALTRRTAELLGDKKKDTFRTKISTTGAFFGARGLARGFARALGLPKPLALIAGSLAGSLVSEGTKIAGRTEAELQSKRGSPTETIFDDSSLKGSEITGDIFKWLVYDSLEENVIDTLDTNNFAVIVVATFVVGSISAVSSTVIKDIGSSIEQKKKDAIRIKVEAGQIPKPNEIQNPVMRTFNTRNITKIDPVEVIETKKFSVLESKYSSSAIEGGVLFASYQVMTKIVAMIVPESFNVKFVFNQVLESIERGIDPDIV